MKTTFQEQILRTKLYKPRVEDHYVIRQTIIDQLEENRHNPLTLVVAATGYGKSVTISQWLDQTNAEHCWISLDEEFNNVHTYFLYLVYAIRSVFPDALSILYDLLQGPEMPHAKVLINFLINGLVEIDQEIIVVLDDYHVIENKQIHEVINSLLKNSNPKLHLVIISRRDPPLNLSMLHTFGDINKVRMAGLSFKRDEVISLAKKILKIQISEKMAERLVEKTEGWIVGLQMALMHMANSRDLDKAIEELKSDQQYFDQYLYNQILLQQPQPARKLLLIASILDQFNRELLEALLKGELEKISYPDETQFDKLVHSILFIIPLDAEGRWFRFHHFFRDFLSKQLEKEHTKEQILDYRKKASLHFEKRQLSEQAIRHAVKSDDVNRIVQIFEGYKHKLLDTDQFARLENWLKSVPETIVDTQPEILLTRAFLHDTKANYTAMQNDLVLAESFLRGLSADHKKFSHLWGEYYAIRSCLSYITGNTEETLNNSKEALNLFSQKATYLRDFALAYRSLALQCNGKFKEVKKLLKKSFDDTSPASNGRMRVLIIISLVHAFEGSLQEILNTALQYRKISLEKKFYVSFTYAIYYIGAVYYLRNELCKAAEYIDEIKDYYYAGRPYWILYSLFTLGFALHAQGKMSQLEMLLHKLYKIVEDYDNQNLINFVNAFEIELAIRQNKLAEAWRLSQNADFENYPPAIFYFYFPQLTQIRLLMSSDEPEKLADAGRRLKQLIEFGHLTHRKNLLIQALPLHALIYRDAGDEESAGKILEEALTLGKPGGHIRNFLDLGTPMQKLIKTLYRKKPDDVYLASIDKAFEEEKTLLRKIMIKESDILLISPAAEIEKITRREVQLLQLIADGYQNKEIAGKLHLAPDTIKKSLYRLYQKLNVHNRASAISKATQMGLIRPSDKMD